MNGTRTCALRKHYKNVFIKIFLPKMGIFSNFQYVSFTTIIINQYCVQSKFELENSTFSSNGYFGTRARAN